MWSVVGGLTTVVWSVVGGRFFHNHWSVVGGFSDRWFLWSVAGYFLGKWSVVGSAWSVVGVTVVGGFVLRRPRSKRPTFNMLYMVSLTKELILLSLKIQILGKMGARNPGRLCL